MKRQHTPNRGHNNLFSLPSRLRLLFLHACAHAEYFPAVLNNIFSLSRIASAKGYNGASLGPKLADQVPRQFSEQQLRDAVNTPRIMGGGDAAAAFIPQYGTTTNVALQGLTMEAKLTQYASKVDALERRVDMMELKAELKAQQCCGGSCSVM